MFAHLKLYFVVFGVIVLSSCENSDESNLNIKYGEDFQSYVKVYKHDGLILCENMGIDPNVMAQELINAGIDVVCSQKGHDGLPQLPALCGVPTGSINIHKINLANLPDAEALGFESVGNLTNYQDRECEEEWDSCQAFGSPQINVFVEDCTSDGVIINNATVRITMESGSESLTEEAIYIASDDNHVNTETGAYWSSLSLNAGTFSIGIAVAADGYQTFVTTGIPFVVDTSCVFDDRNSVRYNVYLCPVGMSYP